MIWATVNSRSFFFCWLYSASPSLAAKNIINLVWVFFPTWMLLGFSFFFHWYADISWKYVLVRACWVLFLLFSQSFISICLQPHGLQHASLPCPSPSLRACSNSCPLSQWWHPTISSSVIPVSSCLQSFPTLGSFPISLLFASDGQSTGVSASALVLPMSIHSWFLLGLTDSIFLSSKDSQETSPAPQFDSISSLLLSPFYIQLSNLYMTTGKTVPLSMWTFLGKVMSLHFMCYLGFW